jgi:hypothetical protein
LIEAEFMNKILLQKVMKDTILDFQLENKPIVNNPLIQPFEEYSQLYFNRDAFNLTHKFFNIENVLSIKHDQYLDLVLRIETYNVLNHIINTGKLHPEFDVYIWSISYKTLDFLKGGGFIEVFKNEKEQMDIEDSKKKMEFEKLKDDLINARRGKRFFWPITLINLILSILAIWIAISKS